MRLSLPGLILLAAVLAAAVTGCASGSTATPDGASSSGAPTPGAASPDANLPTGTQLRAVLAPKSYFPAGYAQNARTTADSQDTYRTQTTPAPAKPDCAQLGSTGWFTIPGVNAVSFAQTSYVDKGATAELDQEVFAFAGTGAATELANVGKLGSQCPGYTDPASHTKVKVAEHATSGLGDGAYTITLTDPGWLTGSTLEAVRVGSVDIFVYSTSGPGNGAAAATKLATYLIGKVKSLR